MFNRKISFLKKINVQDKEYILSIYDLSYIKPGDMWGNLIIEKNEKE